MAFDSFLTLKGKIPDIHKLFIEWDKKAFDSELTKKCVLLAWSNHLTKAAGNCAFYGKRSGLMVRPITIHLSAPILSQRYPWDVVDVLVHEMIHAYFFAKLIFEGEGGHGPLWRSKAEELNRKYGINVTRYHTFLEEADNARAGFWNKEFGKQLKVSENLPDCFNNLKEKGFKGKSHKLVEPCLNKKRGNQERNKNSNSILGQFNSQSLKPEAISKELRYHSSNTVEIPKEIEENKSKNLEQITSNRDEIKQSTLYKMIEDIRISLAIKSKSENTKKLSANYFNKTDDNFMNNAIDKQEIDVSDIYSSNSEEDSEELISSLFDFLNNKKRYNIAKKRRISYGLQKRTETKNLSVNKSKSVLISSHDEDSYEIKSKKQQEEFSIVSDDTSTIYIDSSFTDDSNIDEIMVDEKTPMENKHSFEITMSKHARTDSKSCLDEEKQILTNDEQKQEQDYAAITSQEREIINNNYKMLSKKTKQRLEEVDVDRFSEKGQDDYYFSNLLKFMTNTEKNKINEVKVKEERFMITDQQINEDKYENIDYSDDSDVEIIVADLDRFENENEPPFPAEFVDSGCQPVIYIKNMINDNNNYFNNNAKSLCFAPKKEKKHNSSDLCWINNTDDNFLDETPNNTNDFSLTSLEDESPVSLLGTIISPSFSNNLSDYNNSNNVCKERGEAKKVIDEDFNKYLEINDEQGDKVIKEQNVLQYSCLPIMIRSSQDKNTYDEVINICDYTSDHFNEYNYLFDEEPIYLAKKKNQIHHIL